ncbi:S-methyl-5-thioribose kinase [Petrotoga halophila]|jgi:5-methylthioribose kinase|uniref:Methylthioribose kinase n=1 Tax=Petrotoga halophila DSM 16923 TaxID=1122953 RepID=A0A2S5EIU6_9BACT|nr:S-methyl-5-thioribose kinase [Petrotoga halophila]POZ92985.1 methylthioribose kinase [Petrotoga halophila DSM 16923]
MGNYKPLTKREAIEYVKQVQGIFSDNADLECEEIGDGNLNLVFHICDKNSDQSIIIKQALDHVRIVESWPLTKERVRFEYKAMDIQDKLTNGMVPKVYKFDEELALIVMEDLSDMTVMRKGLIAGEKYPHFADQISTFLSKTIFYTSDLYLDPKEKKEKVKEFINPELCKITEDLVFTDPYYDAETNNINPELRPYLENEFWKKAELHKEVTILKEKFMTKAQSLIHGDLHTGSIFINQEAIKVFDAEFAFYGPSGFDIGAVIGNLILNYASWTGKKVSREFKNDYRNYLLETIKNIWNEFEMKFRSFWDKHAHEVIKAVDGYQDAYLTQLLQDSIGMGGCKTMRRCIGLAHVEDLDGIEDLKKRAEAQIFALKIGEAMVIRRKKLNSIEDFIKIVQKITNQEDA